MQLRLSHSSLQCSYLRKQYTVEGLRELGSVDNSLLEAGRLGDCGGHALQDRTPQPLWHTLRACRELLSARLHTKSPVHTHKLL